MTSVQDLKLFTYQKWHYKKSGLQSEQKYGQIAVCPSVFLHPASYELFSATSWHTPNPELLVSNSQTGINPYF